MRRLRGKNESPVLRRFGGDADVHGGGYVGESSTLLMEKM